jgi:hypothetical protein
MQREASRCVRASACMHNMGFQGYACCHTKAHVIVPRLLLASTACSRWVVNYTREAHAPLVVVLVVALGPQCAGLFVLGGTPPEGLVCHTWCPCTWW